MLHCGETKAQIALKETEYQCGSEMWKKTDLAENGCFHSPSVCLDSNCPFHLLWRSEDSVRKCRLSGGSLDSAVVAASVCKN